MASGAPYALAATVRLVVSGVICDGGQLGGVHKVVVQVHHPNAQFVVGVGAPAHSVRAHRGVEDARVEKLISRAIFRVVTCCTTDDWTFTALLPPTAR